MAPEILQGQPYSGPAVDLFSVGIILFIMMTKTPPFYRAYPTDPLYKLLAENRDDLFWQAHSKNKQDPDKFFSKEFKQLINGLLQYDPALRFSMADVLSSPWYCDNNVSSREEILIEFKLRRQIIQDNHAMKKLKATNSPTHH
jgi:serine/threonine protein kinase